MITLFLKIYEAFEASKELFIEAGLPPIKFIDKYRGQPLNPAQFEFYELPAIFIDYKVKWEKVGRAYDGTVGLEFHIVTDATWDTSNISTNNVEGLKNSVNHALIRSVLDDLESENTTKLQRSEEYPVDSGVVVYNKMEYKCVYSDPMLTGREYVDVLIEAIKVYKNLVNFL